MDKVVHGMPSQADNPEGLHGRYIIQHADGTPTDPNAVYFVLRLDNRGTDFAHVHACRMAAMHYAAFAPRHLRKMAEELRRLASHLEEESL